MSKSRKLFLVMCGALLVVHIVRYFFYNADIVQTTLGGVSMILIIISLLMSKEEKK